MSRMLGIWGGERDTHARHARRGARHSFFPLVSHESGATSIALTTMRPHLRRRVYSACHAPARRKQRSGPPFSPC